MNKKVKHIIENVYHNNEVVIKFIHTLKRGDVFLTEHTCGAIIEFEFEFSINFNYMHFSKTKLIMLDKTKAKIPCRAYNFNLNCYNCQFCSSHQNSIDFKNGVNRIFLSTHGRKVLIEKI